MLTFALSQSGSGHFYCRGRNLCGAEAKTEDPYPDGFFAGGGDAACGGPGSGAQLHPQDPGVLSGHRGAVPGHRGRQRAGKPAAGGGGDFRPAGPGDAGLGGPGLPHRGPQDLPADGEGGAVHRLCAGKGEPVGGQRERGLPLPLLQLRPAGGDGEEHLLRHTAGGYPGAEQGKPEGGNSGGAAAVADGALPAAHRGPRLPLEGYRAR